MADEWKNVYQAAILETDWSKIDGRIQAADAAISARLHEFSVDHGGTPEENARSFWRIKASTLPERYVEEEGAPG